jgi:hypothetical protein
VLEHAEELTPSPEPPPPEEPPVNPFDFDSFGLDPQDDWATLSLPSRGKKKNKKQCAGNLSRMMRFVPSLPFH